MICMKSTSLKIFNILLILLLIVATAVLVFQVIRTAESGLEDAARLMSEIEKKAAPLLYEKTPGGDDVKRELRESLMAYPKLRSLTVYGPDKLLLYAYARHPELLHIEDSEKIERSEVRFKKRFLVDKILSDGASYGNGYYSEGVFELIPGDQLYRFGVYAFIFFAVLTMFVFFLLLVSGKEAKSSPHGGADGTAKSPRVLPVQKTSGPQIQEMTPRTGEPGSDREVERTDSFDPEKSETDRVYSPDSLLCFEGYLAERLDNELKRAAAFDQDLILAMICCVKDKSREKYIKLADEVRGHFEFHDLLFEYGDNVIAVILPNTDLEQGIAELGDFHKNLFARGASGGYDAAIGLSSRNGRLIRSDRIILEAHAAMKKATGTRENRIVGFKPDPGKYRNYLARQSNSAAQRD